MQRHLKILFGVFFDYFFKIAGVIGVGVENQGKTRRNVIVRKYKEYLFLYYTNLSKHKISVFFLY
jgi:hypothetical protein